MLHTDDGPPRRRRPHARPSTRPARSSPTGHDVAGVTDPFAPQSAAVSADGKTAYVDVAYARRQAHGHAARTTPRRSRDSARAGGVQVELTGALAQLAQKTPSSELIGIGVAIIVLLVAFGSVVAMGLPIVTALMGIFVGAAGGRRAVGRSWTSPSSR